MKYWLITDPHLGHDKLVEHGCRPAGYTERILKNISQMVSDEDILINLGDICFGNEDHWHQRLCEATKARKWLVKGNHDKRTITWYLEHGWDFVCYTFRNDMFGQKVRFSHKPVEDDGHYTLNIHGHFHDIPPIRHEPELVAIKNKKQRLISMEWSNYQPITLEHAIQKWNPKKFKYNMSAVNPEDS